MVKAWYGRICTLAVVALLACPQSAFAYRDGHQLLEALSSRGLATRFASIMFVMGVSETGRFFAEELNWSKAYCPGGNITVEDVADAVRIWLRGKSPDALSTSAAPLVLLALAEQFPCD